MKTKVEISLLESHEIENLLSLQPEGWLDIRPVFRLHYGKSYFSSFKGLIDGNLVSVGHIIYCGNVAWLGNIIVHPTYRNLGLGTLTTQYLMNTVYARGINTIYLLATDLGKPVYDKLGFETHSIYAFNEIVTNDTKETSDPCIRKYRKEDWPIIMKLDYKAMGYDRSSVLRHFLEETWVYDDGEIRGFFAKNLGDGLIIASDKSAGWSLSVFRINHGKSYVVVPEINYNSLASIYDERGFRLIKQQRVAYFMFQGMIPEYEPTMIYSRIGGYLG